MDEHTQLASGNAEMRKIPVDQLGKNGKATSAPVSWCVRQHSCVGACYIIKRLTRGGRSVKIRREANYKINQEPTECKGPNITGSGTLERIKEFLLPAFGADWDFSAQCCQFVRFRSEMSLGITGISEEIYVVYKC